MNKDISIKDNESEKRYSTLKIILIYVILGVLWIAFSDYLLLFLAPQVDITKYQTLKGWAFIIITALMLYALISKRVNELNSIIRKKEIVEQELKITESKFNLAFNKSPIALTISSLKEGEYYDVNDEFTRIFGYSKEEIVGKTITELNTWVDLKDRLEFTREINKKGSVNNAINYFRIKGGEVRTFLSSAEKFNFDGKDAIIGVHRDITAEKEREKIVRESELKYRTLVENLQDGLFLIQDGKFVFVNDGLCQMLGYNKQELEGTNYDNIVDFQDVNESLERYQKRLKGIDIPNEFQMKVVKKDVESILVNIKVGTITFRNKLAIIGTVKNISEKKLMETALQYSRSRFNELSELLPFAIMEIDKYGYISFMNKSAFELYGYTKEDFEGGLNVFQMVSGQDLEKAKKEFEILFSEKDRVVTSEYSAHKKNGSIISVLIFASPITRNDEIVGIRAVIVDISQTKKSEEELHKLSLALEQSPVSIIITDIDGNIEYVNPKFLEVSGYSNEEVIGRKPSILKSGEQSLEYYQNLWRTIKQGKDWRGELHNKRKDGSLYWELVSISPIKNYQGEIINYFAVKEDITLSKKYEEELIKAKEKAEESDKLKTNFLAQVSHEIRTPLNIILGYTSYLKDALKNNLHEEHISLFDSIYAAGKRLSRTIDLILNMSVLRTGKIKTKIRELNLNELTKEIIKEFDYLAKEKNIAIEFECSDKAIVIKSDEYILKQILQNLVDNAIKYSDRGIITISLNEYENKVEIIVKDQGIGMSAEYLEKIFSPFSQEDSGYSRKYEGTGLGLALVKNYANLLNIKINVQSKKGEGTTIKLELKH